jgi:sulfopyruvate decarboxylase alpha subunit
MTDAATWPPELYRILRQNDVNVFAYVPDAGHAYLIDKANEDNDVTAVSLTTEEEGVALAAGMHLGGGRAVLLMQSSGLGNCVNFLSLMKGGQFPFVTLITMRGEFGEGNPWQTPMGQAVQPIFEAMGGTCLRIDRAEEVAEVMTAAFTMAYKTDMAIAVLLGQRLIGAKAF